MTSTCPPPYEDYANFSPLQIEIKGFTYEEGLRRFRTMVQKSKILTLYKEKQTFEKPSAKRRRIKRELIEKKRLSLLRDVQMANGEWDKIQKKKEEKRYQRRRNTDD